MRAVWLDNLPERWTSVPFGSIFTQSKQKNSRLERDFVLSVMKGRGVVPYTEKGNVGNKVSDDLSKYKLVDKGDFILNSMNLYMGSVGVSEYDGVTSSAYIVCKPREDVWAGYYNYLIQFRGFQEYVGFLGKGIMEIREAVRWSALKSVFVPLPDLETQKTIADFLDRETARIDQLIEKKMRLVKTIDLRFDSLVQQCVTTGLPDSEYPLVDIGIGYIRKTPSHWSVEKTGWRYSVQLGKMLDSAKQTGKAAKPYLRVADVQWDEIRVTDLPVMDFGLSDRSKYSLQPGDLVVNEGGSYVGRSAIWRGEIGECYYQKALHRLRPRNSARDTTEYFLWVMWFATKHGIFVANGNQTTIDHLTAEALRRYKFSFPPLDEQLEISSFLRQERDRTARLHNEILISVDRLQEYRSALITAAVTGQIDVTTWGKQGQTDRHLDQIQEAHA